MGSSPGRLAPGSGGRTAPTAACTCWASRASACSTAKGLVPAIQFDDVSKVTSISQHACVKSGCYHSIVVVDETSPNDPSSGHQIKYYAPGAGLVKVGANGGDSREFLQLTAVRHLSTAGLSKWRAEALAMDKRAYRVAAKVYRMTPPARQATQ